jgi:hypothetical protein
MYSPILTVFPLPQLRIFSVRRKVSSGMLRRENLKSYILCKKFSIYRLDFY